MLISWYDYSNLVASILSTVGSTVMIMALIGNGPLRSTITQRILLFMALSGFFFSITTWVALLIKLHDNQFFSSFRYSYYYIVPVSAIKYSVQVSLFLWTTTLAIFLFKEKKEDFKLYISHCFIWPCVLSCYVAEIYSSRNHDPPTCGTRLSLVRILYDSCAILVILSIGVALLLISCAKSKDRGFFGTDEGYPLYWYIIACLLLATLNHIKDIADVSCAAPTSSKGYDNFTGFSSTLFTLLPFTNSIIFLLNMSSYATPSNYSRKSLSKSVNSNGAYPDIQELSGLTIEERIGEGIAAVFKGKWRGADVAVKMQLLSINVTDDYKNFQDACNGEIQQEAQMMKSLRHPNIVLFMEAGFFNGSICIISEYCARGSLRDVLESTDSNQLVWAMKIRLALGVAHGVQYLHGATPPMIHRDLKSPNILVDETWHSKVADFGTLRFSEIVYNRDHKLHDQEAGLMTTCVGTTRWMAPEIIRGDAYDEKIDIFSFGVILWEMIEGKLPYHEMKWNHTIEDMILQGKRPEIAAYRCPQRWKVLISMCWQSNPKDRPSIQQVIGCLERVSKEEIWESIYDKKTRYTRLEDNLQSIDCDYILQNTAWKGEEAEFIPELQIDNNSPTSCGYFKFQI